MEESKNEVMKKEAVMNEEPYKSGSLNYIDSREVADMVGKEHSMLLRDIKRYEKQIDEINQKEPKCKIAFSDFFIKSSYDVEGQNRTYPCYLVTKKGCEFIAHKLTGIKGTKFTATYINRFHEMEDMIQNNQFAGFHEIIKQQTELIRQMNERIDTLEYQKWFVGAGRGKLIERKEQISENWYERNKARIYKICTECEVKYSELYHSILGKCAEKYDLESAKETYRKEVGIYPRYIMDIVSYFPELAEIADKFLDSIA